jgi:hypothetical protein
VPSTTFGVELAIAYNPAHFDVEFAAALFASQMATLAAIPSQGASFGLEQVGVRACYEPFDARFDLGPCAGAWYDQIAAHGFGSAPDHPTDATGKIFAASAGGRATVRLSTRVAVRFLGEAIAPAVRPTFIIDGGGLVYHLPAVSLRVAAGAEAHF